MTAKSGDPTGDVPSPTVRTILRAIRDAEAILIAFPRLERALVVDTRNDDGNRPATFIARLGFNAEQQLQAARTARPDVPPMDQFVMLTWGGSTRAFAEQGVLPAVLNRLPPDSTQEAMAAFEQLRQRERGPAKAVGPVAPLSTETEGGEGEEEEGSGDQGIDMLMTPTTLDEGGSRPGS